MRFGRTSKAVGVAAVAALALSACAANTGTDNGGGSEGGEESGGEVRVVEVNAFSSFNPNTATGNVDINSKIAYATQSGFYYVNNDLKVVRQDKFGTYEKTSDDPLTVKYTVNEGVKWSDGEPIDAGDLLLDWAVLSGHFNDAKTDAEGEVTSGTNYFNYAGDTGGVGLTDVPEISDDGRSITLVYEKPYADWEIAFGGFSEIMPAHVVAEKGGLADEDALVELIQKAPEGDPEDPQERPELKKVANFWNTGFDSKALPDDPSLYLSSGPFITKDVVPEQSMRLVRNEDYDWGPMPKVDEITVKYIGEAPAQVQALDNGEVDIIAPQASADTLEQLEAMDGITVEKGNQLSYDHLDLNFTGPFADADVREAFMKVVPREAIVAAILEPLNPEAKPLDSQLFLPEQDAYAEATKVNGSENFQEVDIEGAKKLLAGKKPEVKIMYNNANPNRVDSYTLIAASAEKAGFKVVDGGLGASDWGSALGTGTYDASIFGWINPGVGVTGVPQLFSTDGGGNYSGFSNAEVDKLTSELILTTDEAKQDELQIQIDKQIWDSRFGLPLFQPVGVDAYSERIDGVEYMPNQTGVWWNFWDWSVKK